MRQRLKGHKCGLEMPVQRKGKSSACPVAVDIKTSLPSEGTFNAICCAKCRVCDTGVVVATAAVYECVPLELVCFTGN